MNRSKHILAVLLLTLAASAMWSYWHWPRQKTVAVLKYAPGSATRAERRIPSSSATIAQDDGRMLRLDLLEQKQPDQPVIRRDIFKPFLDETRVLKQKAAKPLPPPLPLPLPPPPPQKELIKFTFLGFLQMEGGKTVFLERNKEIILVKSGDVFGGRFKAKLITDNSLTIVVNDTGEEIIVPLVENRALGGMGR